MNVIELFAGAGGLAQGFERTGSYKTLALFDIAQTAQQTYLANYPKANYYLQDIRSLEIDSIETDFGLGSLNGVLGGPPCQGFSLAGKRDAESELNELVISYADVVMKLKPDFLVMENVPQLMFHSIFQRLVKQLSQLYNVIYGVLNAARYGTPQTRHRLFMVAYKSTHKIKPTFPQPTHGKRGQRLFAYHLDNPEKRVTLNNKTAETVLGADPVITEMMQAQTATISFAITDDQEPLVTVGDAISDLCLSVALDGELVNYTTPPTSEYQKKLRNGQNKVANCLARQHRGEPLNIVRNLPEGGTPNVGADRGKSYYSQAYSRLHRAGLARTLTTYFQNAGSGRFFHYEQPRTLTIREAARLQGFSDNFIFCGNLADQMQLVGNAVPLPLAEAIGRHIAVELGAHLSN